jgi:hypothetical protein
MAATGIANLLVGESQENMGDRHSLFPPKSKEELFIKSRKYLERRDEFSSFIEI